MANPQSSERPDLQDLVAYMQGRGSETLRAQVLKRLDEDEEYLELMMDLVPMLREAGELADPDAAPAPSPIQTFVDAPLPPVVDGPPAGMPAMPGKVVALPSRSASRPLAAYAALAALIPCAVAIWITTRNTQSLTASLSQEVGKVSEVVLDDNPWGGGVSRGGNEKVCAGSDTACFDAGAQMIDLRIALDQGSADRVRVRLVTLGTLLGKDFARYFPGLGNLPKERALDLDKIEKQVRAGDRNLRKDRDLMPGFEEGACLRAAVLAAKMGNTQFFEKRKARGLCLEIVGEQNWKPDGDALEDLYFETRETFLDLP